jgi:hypothetical protein
MRVAAHQPHAFPWLGYLHKVANCDLFVVMDDLQFEAQNYQNRNRVKVNNGTTWLTVPLVRGAQTERICDKRIAPSLSPKEHWQRRIWATLCTHYGKTDHFADFRTTLEEVFTRSWERLIDFDLHMLKLMCGWLRITTPIVLGSTLELQGQKSERIIHLCQRVGASAYYSGKGGSQSYLDISAFERAGIVVEWQTFDHPVYDQRFPELGFMKNLAALDFLFNCGAEDCSRVLHQPDRRAA